MNICTYVTAVSMKPKLYTVSIYKGTKTLSNILNSDIAILQLLSLKQINLVKILGKKSGHTFNKSDYLIKKNLLSTWQNKIVLKETAALLQLNKINSLVSGDHTTFLFEVIKYKVQQTDPILMFQDLVDAQIIL